MPILHVRDVPAILYRKIRKLAESQRRSIGAEVVTLLDRAVQEENLRQVRHKVLQDIKKSRAKLRYDPAIPDSVVLLREDRSR